MVGPGGGSQHSSHMRARLMFWKACDGLSFPHLLHIILQVLSNLASDSFCIRNIVAHEQVYLLDLRDNGLDFHLNRIKGFYNALLCKIPQSKTDCATIDEMRVNRAYWRLWLFKRDGPHPE
jgi:hypothetical protein